MIQGGTNRKLVFWAQILLGSILGLAALYLALWGISFRQLSQVLRDVRLPFLVLAVVTTLLTPVVKAARWRWLFYPQRPALSLTNLSSLVVIGQATNLLLPGRWGELVRTYLTGEEASISKSYVLGTIAAEKLLDIVVLAVVAIALIPLVALPPWLAPQIGYLVVTAVVVSVGAAVLLGGRSLWLKVADSVLRVLPKPAAERWRVRIAAALDGLGALGNRRAAVAIWGWTSACWCIAALTNFLLLLAFDLPPSPLIAVFLLAVMQAGVAVPSTPGKIGVFQYLCVLALSVFKVPASIAFGYSLTLYLLVVGTISAWAAIALWRRSWNPRRLVEASAGWR